MKDLFKGLLLSLLLTLTCLATENYDSVFVQLQTNANHLLVPSKIQLMATWGARLPFYFNNLKAFHKLVDQTMDRLIKESKDPNKFSQQYQDFLTLSKEISQIQSTIDLKKDYSLDALYLYSLKINNAYKMLKIIKINY